MAIEVITNGTSRGRKLARINVYDIHPNPKNTKTIEDIDQLAALIRKQGLIQPLAVYPEGDGYMLIAGHRRREAWILNVEQFDFDEEVECLVYPKPTNEIEERLFLINANTYRRDDHQDVLDDVKECMEIWEMLPVEETAGKNRRDWIATQIGKSGRMVQNYIGEILGKPKKQQAPAKEPKKKKDKKEKPDVMLPRPEQKIREDMDVLLREWVLAAVKPETVRAIIKFRREVDLPL